MIFKKGKYENNLDELFYRDLLLSEKLRVKILLQLLVVMLLVVIFLFIVFREEYIALFKNKESLIWLSVTICFFITYEFIILTLLRYLIRFERNFPNFGRYGNTFFETSIPSVLMIALAGSVNPFIVLNGPVSYGYFIFIVLSILRLDLRLSIFTGLIAAVEYGGVSYYYIINSSEFLAGFQPSHIFYLSKVLLILMSGVAAGFVSVQLKKRVFSTLRLGDERNKIISMFGQQVSPEIAVELLSQGEEEESGVVKDVCIMFLDIRNFTSMVVNKNPKDIVAYQNEIFGLVIEIINKHKGIINQFLGDGLMATFGAPIYRGNDCHNAVNAALEIVNELNKKKGTLLLPTRVGIGIHYGEAVTGNVGSDIRKQYSITGLVVILASRIEQLNKEFDSQILISKEVLDNVNLNGQNYEPLGPVRVKGRDEPIDIYKLA